MNTYMEQQKAKQKLEEAEEVPEGLSASEAAAKKKSMAHKKAVKVSAICTYQT